jgi:uncharacterized protein DUF1579
MKLCFAATSVAALAATFILSAYAWQAGGQDSKPKNANAAMPPPVKAGPEHAALKELVGEWNATFSMAPMTPGTPGTPGAPGGSPMVSTATAKNTFAMNDLWLVQDYTMPDFMGSPFTGHGVLGYDTDRKQYCGFWVDSMTTSAEPMWGSFDAKTHTLTMQQKGKDPMTGKEMTVKMLTHIVDKDNHWFEALAVGPDGKEMQSFKIEYKRKK